jgi:hypothetical protein
MEQEIASSLMQRRDTLAGDLRQLMADAFAPIELRQKTFLDWLLVVDRQTQQLRDKLAAGEALNQMVMQRTTLVRNLREMVLAMSNLQNFEVEKQIKQLEARIAIQKLEIESQKLAAAGHKDQEVMAAQDRLAKQQLEIQQQRAELESLKLEAERQRVEEKTKYRQVLKKERLKTRRMKEQAKQVRMRVRFTSDDPHDQDVVYSQLVDMSKRSRLQQLAIRMFLDEARSIYNSDSEDIEKAARIRALVETYRRELSELPPEIRRFVQRVERDSVEDSYE